MRQALPIKILAFDVFGTVVDWCQSIADEIQQLDPTINGLAFARAWRAEYRPAIDKVRSKQLPWMLLDDLHRLTLDQVLIKFCLHDLTESEKQNLNLAWHRLKPWPDSIVGIQLLKSQFTVCTLSNGNHNLLSNMAIHSQLPWDVILSAETFNAYKPDPKTYLGIADYFEIQPEQVMLVAAHQHDLDAAHQCGLQTAYIERQHEFGSDQNKETPTHPNNTYHATDLLDLAQQLQKPRNY